MSLYSNASGTLELGPDFVFPPTQNMCPFSFEWSGSHLLDGSTLGKVFAGTNNSLVRERSTCCLFADELDRKGSNFKDDQNKRTRLEVAPEDTDGPGLALKRLRNSDEPSAEEGCWFPPFSL